MRQIQVDIPTLIKLRKPVFVKLKLQLIKKIIKYPNDVLWEFILSKYRNKEFRPENLAKDFGISLTKSYRFFRFLKSQNRIIKFRNAHNVTFKLDMEKLNGELKW